MATTTVIPDFAETFAVSIGDMIEEEKVEELNPEQALAAVDMCGRLRALMVSERQKIEEELSKGMDAKEFVAKYEPTVARLETVLTKIHHLVTKARTRPRSPLVEHFVASYHDLVDEILKLHQFLADAVALAKKPRRPIDWERLHQAEEAKETPVEPWTHLVRRRHPWRKQLYIKGRNMTARQLIGAMKAEKRTEEETAEDFRLPVEAVREALVYVEQNTELVNAEAEMERTMHKQGGAAHDPQPVSG